MAILPKYQKTGIKVRQPSRMDFAASREAARLGQAISTQLDRMGEFAFKEAAREAEQRGQERVRQEGAIPVLEQLQAQDGPRTIAERSALEAANRVAIVEIETAARSDMRTLIAEADENNMAMNVFNQKMSDIQDGYTASLQVVDPTAAGVLNARLQEDSVSFGTRYSEIVTRKAKAAWAETTQVILDEGVQKIMDTALQEGAGQVDKDGKTAIQKAGESLLATAQTRGVNQKKAQKLVDTAVNKAIRENIVYRFNNAAGVTEKQAILVELEDTDKLPGMDYESTLRFKDRLSNVVDREIANGQRDFIESTQNAIEVIKHTGEVPLDYQFDDEEVKIYFAENEEDLDVLLRSVEYAKEDVLRYGSLSTMSVDDVKQAESAIRADYEQAKIDGVSGAELTALQKRLVDFQTETANRADRINADPAQYVLETNKEAALRATKAMQALQKGNLQAAAFEINALGLELSAAYDKIGVRMEARQIMSGNMAKGIVAALEGRAQTNPDDAVALFGQYREAFGENSMRFVDELSKAGLKPEFTEAMLSNDTGLHTELMKISQRSTQEIKKLAGAEANDTYKILQEKLTDYTAAFIQGGGAKAQDDIAAAMGVAEKLLYDHMAKTGKTMEDAAQYVVERMFPEFQNVINDANGIYIVPLEFNKNAVDGLLVGQFLRADILEKMGVQPLDVLGAEGYIDEAVSFTNLARQGVWLNNNTGDGVVLHYKTKQGHLVKAKMQDGSDVDLRFKDLRATLNELQASGVTVDRVEPTDAAQTLAPGFGPSSPGFEAGMAALEEAQPVDTGTRFTAEPVPADQAASVAEINKAKTDLQQRYLAEYPDDATTKEKREYFNLLLSEVRNPDIGPDEMTSFAAFRKDKEEPVTQQEADKQIEKILDSTIDKLGSYGKLSTAKKKQYKNYVNYLYGLDSDKVSQALSFDEFLKTQE